MFREGGVWTYAGTSGSGNCTDTINIDDDGSETTFNLDATPPTQAWSWDYVAANLISKEQGMALSEAGYGYGDSFLSALTIHHQNNDLTNYSDDGTIHQLYGLEVHMLGDLTSKQYVDQVSIFGRVMNRTGWSARGCSGIITETHQYGEGIASNEFHIWDVAPAAGGYEQSKSMACAQLVMHSQFANEDATHVSRGLMIDNFGYRITDGIRMSSNADPTYGQYGRYAVAINMEPATVTYAGIVMPNGASTGDEGTIIRYAANDYSYYARGSNAFAWVIGGSQAMSVDSAGLNVNGGLNIDGDMTLTSGDDIKLGVGGGLKGSDGTTLRNMVQVDNDGNIFVGYQAKYTVLGYDSSYDNPVTIKVGGVDHCQVFRGAADSGGTGYRVLRVVN